VIRKVATNPRPSAEQGLCGDTMYPRFLHELEVSNEGSQYERGLGSRIKESVHERVERKMCKLEKAAPFCGEARIVRTLDLTNQRGSSESSRRCWCVKIGCGLTCERPARRSVLRGGKILTGCEEAPQGKVPTPPAGKLRKLLLRIW